ncbi:MAG: hypothetical protein HOP19_29100 [Acidobacteria bacterium]|nr:hypothetical protein [Acidobacteriota bacterium]
MSEQAKNKVRKLWQMDDLFHNTSRYPHKQNVPRTDRLAAILRDGIVAPAACTDGSVCSDLNLTVQGSTVPYDSIVFLHRYGEPSWLYTISQPGHFTVFVDPAFPVMTPQDLEPHWVKLSQDEVYVQDRVPPDRLIALVVNEADAQAVLTEFQAELERLALPLYLYNGTVLWPT